MRERELSILSFSPNTELQKETEKGGREHREEIAPELLHKIAASLRLTRSWTDSLRSYANKDP